MKQVHRHSLAIVVSFVVAIACACDGSDGSADGGGADGGGGGSDAGTTDGGGGGAGCSTLPVQTGALGELTAYPSNVATLRPAGFALHSVNFVFVPADGAIEAQIRMFAEVENHSGANLCTSIPDVRAGGYDLNATSVQGSTYVFPGLSVSTSCVADGESGVFLAVLRGVTESEFLAAVTTLSIDLEPNSTSGIGEMRSTATTLSNLTIEETAAGFVLQGHVEATEAVRNYYLDVFAVDSRGLITEHLSAPDSGALTLGVGVAEDFVSDPSACPFVDQVVVENMIYD
ncbi:MAG: hypothetical protein AB7S26_20705 [Sandaracinaceae bacterium]